MHPTIRDRGSRATDLLARCLLALLFLGGAVQKLADPAPVTALLVGLHLPGWLIWPLAALNLVLGMALLLPRTARPAAALLVLYCLVTSLVHWGLRSDPWQVTIMVKNWAIAGGLLLLVTRPPPAGS